MQIADLRFRFRINPLNQDTPGVVAESQQTSRQDSLGAAGNMRVPVKAFTEFRG